MMGKAQLLNARLLNRDVCSWTSVRRKQIDICFHSCQLSAAAVCNMYLHSRCATKTVRHVMQVRYQQSAAWKRALTHVVLNSVQVVPRCRLSPFGRHVDGGLGMSAHIRRVQVQPHLFCRILECAVRQESLPHTPIIQPASCVAVHCTLPRAFLVHDKSHADDIQWGSREWQSTSKWYKLFA